MHARPPSFLFPLCNTISPISAERQARNCVQMSLHQGEHLSEGPCDSAPEGSRVPGCVRCQVFIALPFWNRKRMIAFDFEMATTTGTS